MPFTIQMTVAETQLMMQQNTACTVILTNTDTTAAKVLHPGVNPWTLTFRVKETKTGIEALHRPERSPFDQETPVTFEAGQSDRFVFPILMRAAFPAPAEYDLTALWTGGPGKPLESNVVRMKILPFTPRNLALFRADYPAFSAAVLNAAVDPPVLLRAAVKLLPGVGIEQLTPVAQVSNRTSAVLSTGPSQAVVPGDWVVWVDGEKIVAAHVDPVAGVSPVRSAPLPPGDFHIVSSAYSAVPPDDGSRPTGAALLYKTDAGRTSLQVFNLTAAAIQPGPDGLWPVVPIWLESRALSDGRPYVVLCVQEGTRVLLQTAPWPSTARPSVLTKITEWADAQFAGAAMTIDGDDNLEGAVLYWKKSGSQPTLHLVSWKSTTDGKYEELSRRDVEYDYGAGISRAIVRVVQSGFFAALIRNNAGRWMLWDSLRGDTKLVGPIDSSPLPLELAVIKSDTPVLVSGTVGTGIQFYRADGTVLKFTAK